jgi:gamma-glutamyltranspeptidase/glutathione hydrolase
LTYQDATIGKLPSRSTGILFILTSEMKRHALTLILHLAAILAVRATLAPIPRGPFPSPKGGMVATVNPIATQAGLDALRAGGNAVDAAIACALTLGVVDGHNSGIGGGCFLTLRLADGRLITLDGRETAPAAATRDMFLRDGKADAKLSQDGALSVGIPGELATLAYASTNFGRLPLAQLLEAAAKVAENGFPIDSHYASRVRATKTELAAFPDARAIFLRGLPTVPAKGDWLKQPDLAKSYRAMATQGVDLFYRGDFAAWTAAWMKAHGGVVTAADFARYEVVPREPVRGTYRGFEIVSFPPPSSGGVHVVEILNLLEGFDLRAMGDTSADFVHTVAEAMKLAFADRAKWLGDPDFTKVPTGLIAKSYAAELAKNIRSDRATAVTAAGTPPFADADFFRREQSRHTTHFSTADVEGNWVACTASLNTSFGSKVVVPGTGILLNNHMDDFSAQPGVPNYFGLVGAEANAISAGKRPLSSMSPTIVLKDGKPILSVGAAGGPTIISQTLLAILRTVDFGKSPREALAGARLHHQWKPDELHVEAAFGDAVIAELRKRGHQVVVEQSLGAAQAVGLAPDGGFLGSADPRGEGLADGL